MDECRQTAASLDASQIQAVIFDMDGLMFDTESMFLKVLPEIGIANGFDLPPAAATAGKRWSWRTGIRGWISA